MRIQIKDVILDNVVIFDEKDKLLIKSDTTDLSLLLPLLNGSVVVNELDNDDNVIWSIEHKYKRPHLITGGADTTLVCPKVIVENADVQEQITNLELALCEIYESMMG